MSRRIARRFVPATIRLKQGVEETDSEADKRELSVLRCEIEPLHPPLSLDVCGYVCASARARVWCDRNGTACPHLPSVSRLSLHARFLIPWPLLLITHTMHVAIWVACLQQSTAQCGRDYRVLRKGEVVLRRS